MPPAVRRPAATTAAILAAFIAGAGGHAAKIRYFPDGELPADGSGWECINLDGQNVCRPKASTVEQARAEVAQQMALAGGQVEWREVTLPDGTKLMRPFPVVPTATASPDAPAIKPGGK